MATCAKCGTEKLISPCPKCGHSDNVPEKPLDIERAVNAIMVCMDDQTLPLHLRTIRRVLSCRPPFGEPRPDRDQVC
jgi:hypothetical protein